MAASDEQIEAAILKNMPKGHNLKVRTLMNRVAADLQMQEVVLTWAGWDKAAEKLLNVNERNYAELKSLE